MTRKPLEEIFREALQKFDAGEAKYGPFDPTIDDRDLLAEAESEILDAINYMGMFLLKIREMGEQVPCRCNGDSCSKGR